MKNLKNSLFSVAIILAISGCSSNSSKPYYSNDICYYPETDVSAPDWICNDNSSSMQIYAVGIAEKSAAGESYMRDMALADARGKIAEQIKVRVSKMVKKYLGTTGKGSQETIDAVSSSTLKTITNEDLFYSRVVSSSHAPNGTLYVKAGIDQFHAQEQSKNVLNQSFENESSLWQEFKADKSFDKMANEILNQF